MIEAIQPSTAKSLDEAPSPALKNRAVTHTSQAQETGKYTTPSCHSHHN
jgi:hypothetical protein